MSDSQRIADLLTKVGQAGRLGAEWHVAAGGALVRVESDFVQGLGVYHSRSGAFLAHWFVSSGLIPFPQWPVHHGQRLRQSDSSEHWGLGDSGQLASAFVSVARPSVGKTLDAKRCLAVMKDICPSWDAPAAEGLFLLSAGSVRRAKELLESSVRSLQPSWTGEEVDFVRTALRAVEDGRGEEFLVEARDAASRRLHALLVSSE